MLCGWWKWKSIFVRFCLILQDLTWIDFNPSLLYAYLNPSNFANKAACPSLHSNLSPFYFLEEWKKACKVFD